MKKIIYVLLLVLAPVWVNAQQTNYRLAMTLLLRHADQDFKSILGDKIGEETSMASGIYSVKEGLGTGTEKIYKSNTSDVAFYTCTIGLTDANAVLKDVLAYVNKKVAEGVFTGKDMTDGKGKNVTYVKNKEGNDIIKIVTQYSDDNDYSNDYFALVIYGKAAQLQK